MFQFGHPSLPLRGADVRRQDITAYSVQKTFPKVEFGEICVGTGGKCGSTHIDRNFLQLMRTRFGNAFNDIPQRRKGPGSEFMASFEKVKQNFGAAGFGTSEDEFFEVHPLNLEGVFDPEHYDEDEAAVILSRYVRGAWKNTGCCCLVGTLTIDRLGVTWSSCFIPSLTISFAWSSSKSAFPQIEASESM
jgi:hypothetical protein